MSAVRLIPIAEAWARTSVNVAVFRRNSVVSHEDSQYAAFYDAESRVVLAKRSLDSDQWTVQPTQYSGSPQDAHNTINIMVDGAGYLHVAWDHHNVDLRYCRSLTPGSLALGDKLPMTGQRENSVTYPEFYRLPQGDLLCFYRDGGSGRGDLVLNHYDAAQQVWTQRQTNLISGEGQRNAYWQITTDVQGRVHLSWVWRESPDVASNHDLCYARSDDYGATWQKSDGETYSLPITADTAEYAARIPQNHELINQTSMCADSQGRPYIATYWRPPQSDVPQYHLVYHTGDQWQVQQVSQRTMAFRLSGGGTRRIPIARPQIVAEQRGGQDRAYMVFRDEERSGGVSLAISEDLQSGEWRVEDLTDESLGAWEPTYDSERWLRAKQLHLFVQRAGQGQGETTEDVPPQLVSVLEWTPE